MDNHSQQLTVDSYWKLQRVVSVARFSGYLEIYPGNKLAVGHLGGVIAVEPVEHPVDLLSAPTDTAQEVVGATDYHSELLAG